MDYTARVIRLQSGTVAGERPMPSAEVAAAHLLMLMRADGWDGDDDATATTLAEFTPVEHKGFSYRVLPPTEITALLDDVRRAGDERG